MSIKPSNQEAVRHNLRALLATRSLMVMSQLAVLGYFSAQQVAAATRSGMMAVLILFAFVILLSFLRSLAHWRVSQLELLAQLCFDALGITALLYFTGGPANPFIAYYLVPVALAAILLSRHYTALVAGLSGLGYGVIMFYHLPLPLLSSQHLAAGTGMDIHTIGMGLTFGFSACVITYFAAGMAGVSRQAQQTLIDAREAEMRNEQISALAALAAGSVGALGTPLATMSVMLEELEACEPDSSRKSDYQLLNQQLKRCKVMLEKLSRTAQLSELGEKHLIDAASYLRSIVSHWRVGRPEASCTVNIIGDGHSPRLEVEFSLGLAIENLLNNAADAWPKSIVISLDWDAHWAEIIILDKGPGIPAHLLEQIGKPIRSDGSPGMGLGLLLSHATINRYGGSIRLENLKTGGTSATLRLPLYPGSAN
jgi:two-component system sensor histidine kinase RegB